MKQIQLGKNGPEVSAPGLGTMGMSDMYGTKEPHNDAASIQTIKASVILRLRIFNVWKSFDAAKLPDLVC